MNILKKIHAMGTMASLLCSIHCMAMPLLIAFLPVIGMKFLASHSFDKWMLIIGVALPLPDLCWGFRKHRSFKAVALLLSGFSWWWLAHEQQIEWRHIICVAACGICFVTSNLMNRRLCKECSHCQGN